MTRFMSRSATMPRMMLCTIPSPRISPILRALVESGAAELAAKPEPYDWALPEKPSFTGNRHERRAQAARARKA